MYIAIIAGGLIGILLSVLFGVFSRSGSDAFTRRIFGMSSYDFIFDGIVFIMCVAFLFLATVSGVVRDLAYPYAKPVNFTIETLLMAIVPSLVFFAMAYLRGHPITLTIFGEFAVLVAKFGVLHVLLQFSGFYSSIFH